MTQRHTSTISSRLVYPAIERPRATWARGYFAGWRATKRIFITLSFWESQDAIAAFAGTDASVARYYPEDEQFLLELEPN